MVMHMYLYLAEEQLDVKYIHQHFARRCVEALQSRRLGSLGELQAPAPTIGISWLHL